MSMIRCPECGHEISGKASFCPHCGRPTGKTPVNIVPGTIIKDKPALSRFLYFMAVLIFIGGLIISICSNITKIKGYYGYETYFSWSGFFIQFPTFVIEGLLTLAVAKLVDEIHATYEMVSGMHTSAADPESSGLHFSTSSGYASTSLQQKAESGTAPAQTGSAGYSPWVCPSCGKANPPRTNKCVQCGRAR